MKGKQAPSLRINQQLLNTLLTLQCELVRGEEVLSDKQIHQLRLATKRARAESVFVESSSKAARMKRRAKKLAKVLACKRDAKVMMTMLDQVVSYDSSELVEVEKARLFLQEHFLNVPVDSVCLSRRLKRLTDSVQESELKSLQSCASNKILKQAKIEMRRQAEGVSTQKPESFHEWRKSVKRYLFLMEVLQPNLSAKGVKRAKQLKKLGERLGELHDLQQLGIFLEKRRPDCYSVLRSRLAEYQSQLYQEIDELGASHCNF